MFRHVDSSEVPEGAYRKVSSGGKVSAHIECTDDGLRLIGDLDFVSVPELYRRSGEVLAQTRIRMDLEAVENANSAGVALLLEWRRDARGLGIELEFLHVPEAVIRVARLSGVEHLLMGKG